MESLRWIYVCAFDRISWILRLGVWESAGLWVESDAPKLSSVSVPGSVTSAPWETKEQRELIKKMGNRKKGKPWEEFQQVIQGQIKKRLREKSGNVKMISKGKQSWLELEAAGNGMVPTHYRCKDILAEQHIQIMIYFLPIWKKKMSSEGQKFTHIFPYMLV